MHGRDLIGWIEDPGFGRSMAGSYLAGFLHSQVACESRVSEFSVPLNIPSDVSGSDLIQAAGRLASSNPEYLDLDIATFMYAVFDVEFSE